MEPTLQAYTTQKTGFKFQFSSKQLRILAIVSVFIITTIGIGFYIAKYMYKSKAGTEDVTLQFTPSASRVEPNQEFSLPLRMTADSTKVISGAQLYITYDDNQDKVDYIPQQLSGLSADYTDLIVQEVTQVGTKKQLKLTVTATTAAQLKNVNVINLKFKAKSQIGQVTFHVDTTSSQVSGTAAAYIFNLIAEDKTIGIGQDVTITPTTITSPSITPITGTPAPIQPEPGAQVGRLLYSPIFSYGVDWSKGKQFTNMMVHNPSMGNNAVVVTVFDQSGAELKKINRTIAPRSWWNSYADPEWDALKGTAGVSGWIKVEAQQPVYAVSRHQLTTGSNYNSPVFDFDDEFFTTKLVNTQYIGIYNRKAPTGDGVAKQFSQLVISNPNEQESSTVNVKVFEPNGSQLGQTITVTIPAKNTWSSFNKPEWNELGGTAAKGGWVEINSTKPVIGYSRETFRATDELNSELYQFNDNIFVSPETNNVGSRLYSPMYSSKWPWGANQGYEFSQVVISNPNDVAVPVDVRVYKQDQSGNVKVDVVSKTIPAKGTWDSFGRSEWHDGVGSTASKGWIEISTRDGRSIIAENRTTLRKGDIYNSVIDDFNDMMFTNKPSDKFIVPYYLKKWPWPTESGSRGGQFSNPIIMNPNKNDINVTITLFGKTEANLSDPASPQIGQISRVVKAGGIWNSTTDNEWNSLNMSDTYQGWMEVVSSQPMVMMNRIYLKENADYQSKTMKFDEELSIAVGTNSTIDPFPTPTQGPIVTNNPSQGPSPIACSPSIACPAGYSCVSNTCRPLYCQSASISNSYIAKDQPATITSTANENNINQFSYAFYNLDNIDPVSNTPKAIAFESGTSYVINVDPSNPTNTASTTINFDSINRPDVNNGGAIPKNIQVNAYFLGPKGFSAPAGACVVKITTQKPDLSMKMKLRFQGIVQKVPAEYNSMNVKVMITGGGLTERKETVATFKQVSNELWEGTVGFNGTFPATASNYAIFVKGPKHLQRKICDRDAKDDENGFYTCTDYAESFITLNKGDNEVDLSNIIQPAGDLPMNNNQDGVIDSIDLVYLRSKLGSKNAADFATGDLNLDGIIDSQDHSLPVKVLDLNKNTDDE